jgi:hypothetical protein
MGRMLKARPLPHARMEQGTEYMLLDTCLVFYKREKNKIKKKSRNGVLFVSKQEQPVTSG